MKDIVKELIEDRHPEKAAKKIVEELVSGKYTHDFPITAQDACGLLGDCVSMDLPREVYTLMNLYKMETRQRRPSVEFVPTQPVR